MPGVELFEYHGPRVRVVALDLDVSDGQQVYGPAALGLTAGFEKIAKSKASESRLVNALNEAADAAKAGAFGGSGEQAEEDR